MLVDTNFHVVAPPLERHRYPLDPLRGAAEEFSEAQSTTAEQCLALMEAAGVDQAYLFALVSIGVVALIVWYHKSSGRNTWLSVALGLLLGGALGNMIDRFRFGYVTDWVDVGLGDLRFYTFNVADAAISCAILLLIILALWPTKPTTAPTTSSATTEPAEADA